MHTNDKKETNMNDQRQLQSEWLEFRDIMAKGVVVSKYSHSILNSFRSPHKKRWKFRRLTIKSNGFLDWQTNCILLSRIKQIKCGQNNKILYSEQLQNNSLTLCTKKRSITFQFKSSSKRDGYLINLLQYLSLSPFDRIRCIPQNFKQIKNLFPIKNKCVIINLKRIKKPQKLWTHSPKQSNTSDKATDFISESVENQMKQQSISVQTAVTESEIITNEQQQNVYEAISAVDSETVSTSQQSISIPALPLLSDIVKMKQQSKAKEQKVSARSLRSDCNLTKQSNDEMVNQIVEERLKEYCQRFLSKLKCMEQKYKKVVETLKKYKAENDALKAKLRDAQRFHLVVSSPSESIAQTEAALEVLDREIQNSMMRIGRLSGSVSDNSHKAKNVPLSRSQQYESLRNDGDEILTKLLLLKQKNIEEKRQSMLSRNSISWR